MKRWIHSNSDINLDLIKLREQELKQFFKQNPGGWFVGRLNSTGSMIEEYIVCRGFSKRSIELYKHIVDSDRPNYSFGGGITLAKGYWDVAQYMLNAEQSGIEFVENI